MTNLPSTTISAGKALTVPDGDKLGYRHFAKMLADGLHSMSPVDGFVVAIHGAWGAGKSSFVNFVIHYLKEFPKQDQPLIVQFNPWWFSGQEDLATRFFHFLISAITNDPDKERKKKLKKVAERISSYASQITLPVPIVGSMVKEAATVTNKALQEKADIFTLKQEVETALAGFDGRILVVIDDIDRLTAEEIRQLFRLVKAVADFPKVIYLLAFDRRVVVNALQAPPIVSGDDYLEKIVQAPFELPNPSEDEMEQLLIDEMETLFEQTPTELRNQMYWNRIWNGGLSHFLKTPRHIVRLVNALRVTYPPVAHEVSSEDFVTMEALRLFCPNAYDALRRHKAAFAGQLQTGLGFEKKKAELEDLYKQITDQVPPQDTKALQSILSQIFPLYESIFGPAIVHYFDEPLAHLRVAYPDAFDIYFHLRLPIDRLSHDQMKSLISMSQDVEAFSVEILKCLRQQDDFQNQSARFLRQIWDYLNEPSFSDYAPNILFTLVQLGDTIIQELSDFDTNSISRLVIQLLYRCDSEKRTDILRNAMLQSSALGTLTSLIGYIEYEHGIRDHGSPFFAVPLVQRDAVEELRTFVLEKVRVAAQDRSLFHVADLRGTLYGWLAWVGNQELIDWASGVCQEDQDMLDFLGLFVYSNLVTSNNFVKQIGYSFDLKLFSLLVDIPVIARQAESLSQRSNLSEKDQINVSVFLKAVREIYRDEGHEAELSDELLPNLNNNPK